MNTEQRHIELLEAESSQRQHFDVIQHQVKLGTINEQAEYCKFALLKPKLYKDGNEWCCLYGENLQEGLAGFGKTPHEAVMNWNAEWHKI